MKLKTARFSTNRQSLRDEQQITHPFVHPSPPSNQPNQPVNQSILQNASPTFRRLSANR
ncbi:MAG: hypothetical protein WCU80_02440 [Paludibacteraceae bacterium]